MSRPKQLDTQFTWQETTYILHRYPQQHRQELRAWDTADQYLLNTLMTMKVDLSRLCILHDHFGALTIPLARYQPICYGDSWMSRRAIELNLAQNQITTAISFVEDLEHLGHLSPTPSVVIGKIPKKNSQLVALLQVLNSCLSPNTPLLLAGMDKHLSRSQYQLLEQYFGPSEFLPGVKKARVWRAYCRSTPNQTLHSRWGKGIDLPKYELNLQALPNVFSRDRLDIGSRFFLENFSRLPMKSRVTDLACGYGVLGLAYLRLFPKAQLTFCDESFQAIASTQHNFAKNFSQASARIYADDGLKQLQENSQGLILCNPPFHQQHTVSTDIAKSLFYDASRALEKMGELWVVANRHLNYHRLLTKDFTHCSTIMGNKKFVILRAIK